MTRSTIPSTAATMIQIVLLCVSLPLVDVVTIVCGAEPAESSAAPVTPQKALAWLSVGLPLDPAPWWKNGAAATAPLPLTLQHRLFCAQQFVFNSFAVYHDKSTGSVNGVHGVGTGAAVILTQVTS